MNLQNKYIRYLAIPLFAILVLIQIVKYLLGYTPIGFAYSAYFNLKNNAMIKNNNYEIKMPFFEWRIKNESNTSITLHGMKTKNGLMIASISKSHKKNLSEVVEMCADDSNIIKDITIDNVKSFDIYCQNKTLEKLKPYRIIWTPEKLFLFMYDYQEEYEGKYEKLISNIRYTKL